MSKQTADAGKLALEGAQHVIDEIREELYRLQDREYGEFQKKLIPTVGSETVIGVRTPALRKYAKTLVKQEGVTEFLHDLPHRYFDEDQLHAFILSEMKNFETCIRETCGFLPWIDNWATCDQLSPKVFKKHRSVLLEYIREWISSDHTYTIRFGVGMLMEHYLDEDFDTMYPDLVSHIRSEEYYVKMMIAWYFATALAKQYERVLPYIEGNRLDQWTHNKAIQKSLESFRITDEQKAYLRGLKRK